MTLSTELLCHSAFSFLDGASEPEELAARAAALGRTVTITRVSDYLAVPALLASAAEPG